MRRPDLGRRTSLGERERTVIRCLTTCSRAGSWTPPAVFDKRVHNTERSHPNFPPNCPVSADL